MCVSLLTRRRDVASNVGRPSTGSTRKGVKWEFFGVFQLCDGAGKVSTPAIPGLDPSLDVFESEDRPGGSRDVGRTLDGWG